MYCNRQSVSSYCSFWGICLTCLISTHIQGQMIWSFHYENLSWKEAVVACMYEGSELLCYSNREEMVRVVTAFRFGVTEDTSLKIWLSSTNCVEYEEHYRMKPCLYLNVNKTEEGGMWPFFQISCNETLPFICSRRQSVGTSSSMVTEEETRSHSTTLQNERTSQEDSSVIATLVPGKTTDVSVTSSDNTSIFTTSHEDVSVPATSSVSSSDEEVTESVYSVTDPTTTVPSTSTEISTLSPVFHCKATTRRGVEWPNAPLGEEISKLCPGNSIGTAKWTCTMSGYWNPENPDMSNCQSRRVLDIKEKHFSLPANDTIDALDEILLNESDIYGNDLMNIVSITASLPDKLYEETASLPDKERWSVTAVSVTKTTSIMDSIVGLTNTWDDLSQEETVAIGSNILKVVDDCGILLGDALIGNDTHNIFTKYIAMQVLRIPFGEEVNVPFGQQAFGNLDESIVLSDGYDAQLDTSDGNLSVVYARYTNMDHILLSSGKTKGKRNENILNSAVVSAVVSQGRSAVSISADAEISVRHLVAEPNYTACVFWNLDRNDWDTTGCRLELSNTTHSICVCDHLTNFAVLMDFQGRIKDVESLPFFYITVIGCSISIFCLVLCIAVFICYSCFSRNVWGLRYTIHRNLCITLLIANILLIAGLNRTNNKVTCSIVAGLLHYFFLSAFSWMLLEGFHIYLLLVVVFASKRSHWEKYYIFGYGFPLLIVVITAVARPDGYGTEKICWLSVEKGIIWSFTGPVACILTVNCCALILAQWKASKISVKDDNIALIKRWLRVTLILFPILGITWLLGFFYVGKHFKVAAYLFALLNSLQGFCIFICHCVMDTKARNLVLNSLRKKQASVTTESSGTLKKLKTEKAKRSVIGMTPVEDTNLTPVKNFKIGKPNPLKRKWDVWQKPWTFYFNFNVTENSQCSALHEEEHPKAVVLAWNIPHQTDPV